MWNDNVSVSPSRTYVAQCIKSSPNGHYFRKFVLPESYKNDSETASWYFLNKLDLSVYSAGCITFEDFQDITDVQVS